MQFSAAKYNIKKQAKPYLPMISYSLGYTHIRLLTGSSKLDWVADFQTKTAYFAWIVSQEPTQGIAATTRDAVLETFQKRFTVLPSYKSTLDLFLSAIPMMNCIWKNSFFYYL